MNWHRRCVSRGLSFALLSLLALAAACEDSNAVTPDVAADGVADTQETSGTLSISPHGMVEIGLGARPEVVLAGERVFVVYSDFSSAPQKFSVRVYGDKDLANEVAYLPIDVSSQLTAGMMPTDIRVTTDGTYAYAAFEALSGPSTVALFVSKYRMDESFERVAYTQAISTAPIFTSTQPGDELLNDPIILLGDGSLFVGTRLQEATSFSQGAAMRYRFYRFDLDLVQEGAPVNLDLAAVTDAQGGARQASAIARPNGFRMLVSSTTVAGAFLQENVTPSDLLLVDLDWNFQVQGSHWLTDEPANMAAFATGLQEHNGNTVVTYRFGEPAGNDFAFNVSLQVHGTDFGLLHEEVVRQADGPAEELRSSLAVRDDRIYVGLGTGMGPTLDSKAVVYVYEVSGW